MKLKIKIIFQYAGSAGLPIFRPIGCSDDGFINRDHFTFTGARQIKVVDGTVLSSAPADQTQVTVVEIDEYQAEQKWINPHNDVIRYRRRSFYEGF